MKIKFSILFTILLMYNLSGLYSQGTCKVLTPELIGTYTGKCKNGLAHGQGIAEGKDKYEGKFKNGLPDGFGKYTWSTSEVYDGKWKEGKRNGKGNYYIKVNGTDSILTGLWENNVLIKKITPPPYRVTKSIGISRYTVNRISEGNRVIISGIIRNSSNISINQSSGVEYNPDNKKGYENITFPFNCTITFTPNTIPNHRVEFEIYITQSGWWEITLYN